jgi:hypothetical protein
MRTKLPQGTRYQISKDGIPRRYCDRKDLALQTARFLKSQNPNSTVMLKDLRTGEEAIIAFGAGE